MRQLQIRPLQWCTGAYLALIGALMLIAPHQFAGPSFVGLQPNLALWGALFFIGGSVLIAAAVLAPRGWLVTIGHVLAGAALLFLASGVAAVGAWLGATGYAVLGIGNLLAAALGFAPPTAPEGRQGDLAALLVAIASLISGLIVFALPSQLGSAVFDPVRGALPLYAAGYVVGGVLVAYVQLRPAAPRPLIWGAHVLLATVLVAFVAPFVPLRVWTGMLYAGLFGGLLVLLPALGGRSVAGPPSLRTRLALALAGAAALPLVAAVAITAEWSERSATAQTLGRQQAVAEAVAHAVYDYVELHRAAVSALASFGGLAALPPDRQHDLLRGAARAYPDVVFVTTNPAGQGLARSDEMPPASVAGYPFFEEVRRADAPGFDLMISPVRQRPVVAFGVPMHDQAGRFAGIVGGMLDTRKLGEVAGRAAGPGGTTYLVDQHGDAIAYDDPNLPSPFADLTAPPPVAAMRSSADRSGSLRYTAPGGDRLAGYARIGDFGWGVVVESPASVVLAGERAARDLAFGLLLVAIAGMAGIGALAVGGLTTPLRRLAGALAGLGAGGDEAPLPHSEVPEIAGLAAVFARMRERLTSREAERTMLLRRAQTARSAAEESERRYRAVSQLTSDYAYAFRFEPDGTAVREWTTDAFARISGYMPEAFDVAGWETLLHPDDRHMLAERFRVLLAGQPDTREWRIVTASGETRWLRDYALPVLDEVGPGAIRIYAAAQDITDRKQAEEEQRFLVEAGVVLGASLEEGETLRRLAELVVPALADRCIVDLVEPDGIPRRVAIVARDPAKAELLREMRRRYPFDPGRPHALLGVLRTGQAVLRASTGEAQRAEVAQDEEHLAMLRALAVTSWLCVPLKVRGDVLGALTWSIAESGRRYGPRELALAEEVAARAALAIENARLYQRAQAAIRLRDDFLGVAAHELRTPITSLRGFAQVILRQLDRSGEADPERVRRAMEQIERQSHRLNELVAQLLDVARLDAGKLAIQPRETDLAALVGGLVAMLSARYPAYSLVVRAPERVSAAVDQPRLEQVLTNLIDNAAKFSPAGSSIEIEVGSSDAMAWMSVRDHGVGVPAGQRAQIFERFYQSDQDRHGGMGLGLFVSRQIVEMHGGAIAVEEPDDGGSRFVVRLPRAGVAFSPVGSGFGPRPDP